MRISRRAHHCGLPAIGVVGIVVLGSCEIQSRPSPATAAGGARDTIGVVQPIDASIAPAVAGEDGWNYQEVATADVTGDSVPERVVLTARVELYRGRPAWDDGQPWQVYVESRDGRRTYLYAQRLQLGTLTMRVSAGDSVVRPSIVLIEHVPERLRLLEVHDTGSGLAAVVRFERELDPRGETASPRFR